jgi:hypothetical protein
VAVGIEADQKVFQFYGVGVLPARRCGTSLDHGVLLVKYMYINIHVYVYVFWVLDGGRPRALLSCNPTSNKFDAYSPDSAVVDEETVGLPEVAEPLPVFEGEKENSMSDQITVAFDF